MKRLTVRFGAAASAAAVTLFELIGIASIAEVGSFSGNPVVMLPRVVVTPDVTNDASGESVSAQALMSGPLPRT